MTAQLIPGRRHFVHRFRWSDDGKRVQFRKALRDGLVKVIQDRRDGWLYEVVGSAT